MIYKEETLLIPEDCRDVEYLVEYITTVGLRHMNSLSIVKRYYDEAFDVETYSDLVPNRGLYDKNGNICLGQTRTFWQTTKNFKSVLNSSYLACQMVHVSVPAGSSL
jgi:hypothetical protein